MKTPKTESRKTPVRRGGNVAKSAAFSYIEAIAATFILATGVTAGMNLFGSYARASLDDQEAVAARELAGGLMSEILGKYFENPALAPGSFGRAAGETARSMFNDVDDYSGWTEAPPQAADGTALSTTLYSGYSRAVVVQNVSPTALNTTAANGTTAAKRIQVVVTRRGRELIRLSGYRFRNDAYN